MNWPAILGVSARRLGAASLLGCGGLLACASNLWAQTQELSRLPQVESNEYVIPAAYSSIGDQLEVQPPFLGRFRIGNFFVPFSLEQVANDTNNIFMERSIPSQGIADTYTTGNVELAIVWANFTLQSEAFVSSVDLTAAGPTTIGGAYAHVSWFLTGENRIFERFGQHGAQFGRNNPYTNFFVVPGCVGSGAWEA